MSETVTRSVLIVTPFFAPQSHAAVFRAYKLAKYLPSMGWKPYVLTVDKNYRFNEDPALIESLPAETEIHTARHIEPTLRGLRMALGGRDRRFAALKRGGASFHEQPSQGRARWLRRAYGSLLHNWAQSPDEYWTWYGPAVRKARALIRRHQIPLVYTTALPYTSLRIGMSLQRLGVRWVADFRDPGSYAARMSSRIAHVYARQWSLEGEALKRADAVTVLSSMYPMIFHDMHGVNGSTAIRFIPTGADDELVQATSDVTENGRYIVFCGEFLAEYGGHFLEAFARAIASDPHARSVKLLIVGRLEVNRRTLMPLIGAMNLERHVELVDHLPQSSLYPLIRGAMAGVLVPGRRTHWWNNFAKMVDFIALQKPVLALVPDPSEARAQLKAAGLGVFLDGDTDAQARRLADFLTGRVPLPVVNRDACARYLAARQVADFAEVFEWCLARPRGDEAHVELPAWAA